MGMYKGRMDIAIESGRALNLGPDAPVYRSSAEEIIYVAALRGHRTFHYRIGDVRDSGTALMSELKLKPTLKNYTNVYENMELGGQEEIPLDQMDVHILKGDDITTGSPQTEILKGVEDKSRFLVSVDTFLALRDKYELFRRCPDILAPSTRLADEVDDALDFISMLPDNEYVAELKEMGGDWMVLSCDTTATLFDNHNDKMLPAILGLIE